MIAPEYATLIVLSLIVVCGVIVPILEAKMPRFISYRWTLVVIIAALVVGATLDFEQLSDDARRIILLGGVIVIGSYILLRTAEKALANGWLKGASAEFQKGDMSFTVSGDVDDDEKKNQNNTEK